MGNLARVLELEEHRRRVLELDADRRNYGLAKRSIAQAASEQHAARENLDMAPRMARALLEIRGEAEDSNSPVTLKCILGIIDAVDREDGA